MYLGMSWWHPIPGKVAIEYRSWLWLCFKIPGIMRQLIFGWLRLLSGGLDKAVDSPQDSWSEMIYVRMTPVTSTIDLRGYATQTSKLESMISPIVICYVRIEHAVMVTPTVIQSSIKQIKQMGFLTFHLRLSRSLVISVAASNWKIIGIRVIELTARVIGRVYRLKLEIRWRFVVGRSRRWWSMGWRLYVRRALERFVVIKAVRTTVRGRGCVWRVSAIVLCRIRG